MATKKKRKYSEFRREYRELNKLHDSAKPMLKAAVSLRKKFIFRAAKWREAADAIEAEAVRLEIISQRLQTISTKTWRELADSGKLGDFLTDYVFAPTPSQSKTIH